MLYHDPKNTGMKQGSYIDEDGVKRRVQPDIYLTYKGKDYVIDTKRKENSYVDHRDVTKMHRDGRELEATPVMVHHGDKISDVRMSERDTCRHIHKYAVGAQLLLRSQTAFGGQGLV